VLGGSEGVGLTPEKTQLSRCLSFNCLSHGIPDRPWRQVESKIREMQASMKTELTPEELEKYRKELMHDLQSGQWHWSLSLVICCGLGLILKRKRIGSDACMQSRGPLP
jgi:hypothetical protein